MRRKNFRSFLFTLCCRTDSWGFNHACLSQSCCIKSISHYQLLVERLMNSGTHDQAKVSEFAALNVHGWVESPPYMLNFRFNQEVHTISPSSLPSTRSQFGLIATKRPTTSKRSTRHLFCTVEGVGKWRGVGSGWIGGRSKGDIILIKFRAFVPIRAGRFPF